MSEALEAVKKEKQIQARLVSTTLLIATSLDTINPKLLKAVGFNPRKAPTMVHSDAKVVSVSDLTLDSDQEPTITDNPQATAVMYSQQHQEAIEAGQADSKCHQDLMKLSTSLPTLPTAWALHLPIDNAQVGWLNHFLTNMDIPNDVHLKHQ